MADGSPSIWMLALFIGLPLLVLILLLLALYLLCSKRYKLNWFEKNLLEDSSKETSCLNVSQTAPSGSAGYMGVRRGSKSHVPLITPGQQTDRRSIGYSESSEESFWVPQDRRRSSSTASPILYEHHGSAVPMTTTSSAPLTTTSSAPLQEMAMEFPNAKFGEAVQTVHVTSSSQPLRRGRRASMQDAIDISNINATLYRESSQTSFEMIPEENLGSIHLVMNYGIETAILTVTLIEARDLVPRDVTGTLDPYCLLRLAPKSVPKKELQSKVNYKTSNPEFNEEFMFDLQNIEPSTLEVLVYNNDVFSQDECIGQVRIPLSSIDFSEQPVDIWKHISAFDISSKLTRGDVMFSATFLPSAERLTVAIFKARNVHTTDDESPPDCFVKVSIIVEDRKLKKKKTSVISTKRNPVWNECLVLGVSKEMLQEGTLEVAVIHDNLVGNKEMLGRVCLSKHAKDEEFNHWADIVNGKTDVARWHSLTI